MNPDPNPREVESAKEEPDAPGVWYDLELERWACASFRPFPVGDSYERRICLWRIYDDGCEAIPEIKRKGRWVKVPAPTKEWQAGEIARLEADNHRLRLGDMSVFDYERLIEWIKNPERKPPTAAFTAGAARTACIAIQDSGILGGNRDR